MMTRRIVILCAALGVVGLSLVMLRPGTKPARPEQEPSQVVNVSVPGNGFDLLPVETRVLGQQTWLRGGPASLRVIVTNHQSGKPLNATVALTLQSLTNGTPSGPTRTLCTGRTDALGTLEAGFTTPSVAPGPYQLGVAVHAPIGDDSVTQPVQVQESTQLMLTADKPLYQPGQVIHLRALALDMATRNAVTDAPVVFEVEDGRGNKVFKQREPLSKFGIAGVDFTLADEVNMGTFTLRAVLPQGQAEKKVRVERYVLPKFKTSLTTDKPFYLPGETVHGTLQANYFFGKPVAGGQVVLAVNTLRIGMEKIGEVQGKTDAKGEYRFDYRLPDAFIGQPFEQGKAVVEFAGEVKDTAAQKQQAHTTLPVVKTPITLALVPERRTLAPGVQNRVYIALATPDGAPLKHTEVRIVQAEPGIKQNIEQKVTTDDLGLAIYEFTPTGSSTTLTAAATDRNGRQASASQTLQGAPGHEALILRSDRTLAKVGDRLNLVALSSAKSGSLYLDVLRNRQTILTRAQPLSNGEGRIALPLTPDMVGTLEIHAYKILPNEDIIRDTCTVVVSSADDLDVRITADKAQYKPGEDAVLQIAVSDAHQQPALAALGLAVVDESVFALSELQPGLEKIYFTLEKELMEPKYEIHGLKPTGLLEAGPDVMPDPERQRAAAMLLASAPRHSDFEIHLNSYQTRLEAMQIRLAERMQQADQTIRNGLQRYRAACKTPLRASQGLWYLVGRGYLKENDLRDPWGHSYQTNLYGAQNYSGYFTLRCAGPDGKWNTGDDLANVGGFVQGRFRAKRALGGADFEEMRMNAASGAEKDKMALIPAALPQAAARPSFAGGRMKFEAKESASAQRAEGSSSGGNGGGDAPRVREYFPETMYWNPALITDEKGHAEVRIPMADSITTWRLSALANTPKGALGSTTSAVKVFQDFFIDLDLPVSLTRNDRVEVPVAVYNYLPTAQEVTLNLETEPWFTLQGPAQQRVKVEPGQVKMVGYPLVVQAFGRHTLTVTAKGTRLSDAIRRPIEVLPDGKQVDVTINDRLEGRAQKRLTLPAGAIQGASKLWVKLYPGAFSQVVEGLNGMLQMPYGCFEQSSSTTYPNVLALDYLKANKKANPELQMKAEQYINVGYQRLVTFECKGGGFSWFGAEPAHQVLTAYGLLEFSDMSHVHDVDPALIQRTQNWLAAQQKPDGSWEEKNQGIEEGIINRQTGALRTTAYIAWALAESGYQGPQVATGIGYVKEHGFDTRDPYTLAVILNLLAKTEKDSETTAKVAGRLIDLAKTGDKTAWWQGETRTFTGASGEGADIETTGLAAYGLAKWGRNAGFTTKVLTYLVHSKDSSGAWQSTQGTVWALKSLLYASKNSVGSGRGTVTVTANRHQAATFAITPEDSDVMRQVDLKEQIKEGVNDITLQYQGDGSLVYQIVGRSYVPWNRVEPSVKAFQPLALSVAYDKKTLAKDDTATVTVTIRNNTDRFAEMPLVDVGVPPGFTVVPDRLDAAVQHKSISKYTVAARQVIVYLERLNPAQTVTLTYQIRAKYPLKAMTPLSRVYPYYDPKRVATSAPQEIVVHR